MPYPFFIGIEVSKVVFDGGRLDKNNPGLIHPQRFANSDAGLAAMVAWLPQWPGFSLQQSLFCLEHTGICPPAALFPARGQCPGGKSHADQTVAGPAKGQKR